MSAVADFEDDLPFGWQEFFPPSIVEAYQKAHEAPELTDESLGVSPGGKT